MKRFYPIAVHSGCRGYNVGNQLSVEWQRPVTIISNDFGSDTSHKNRYTEKQLTE
jgi:hypothetical protein